MPANPPPVVILSGANGAGKTTAARTLLAETLRLMTFVNADAIALGLSGFDPESMAIEAGRIMLRRLHGLADQRASFRFRNHAGGPILKAADGRSELPAENLSPFRAGNGMVGRVCPPRQSIRIYPS